MFISCVQTVLRPQLRVLKISFAIVQLLYHLNTLIQLIPFRGKALSLPVLFCVPAFAVYRYLFQRDDRNITRGNSYKLKTKRARLMLRANFFSVGVVRDWNSLPDTVVTSGTLNQFKNSLDRHLSADKFAQRWQDVERANTRTELMIWSIQVADLSSLTRSSRWFKVISTVATSKHTIKSIPHTLSL